MCQFYNSMLCAVTYGIAREAMNDEPFTMSLTGEDEIRAVVQAVNQGIDSHLEACYCPGRGDRYEGGKRKAGKLVLCRTLECCISPQSLPILLRRLFELDSDDEVADAGMSLADGILISLGIDEYGKFVGREAVGLA